ncbi:TRM11 family SAM-dependent methyltransferase [Streptomyces buecherae]|uniref:TRM11 family SAM-dependent methyltransferase n=1 Tax=Streptomyces buecherae TaxID=2763006 RepID=UPI003F53E6C2
MHERRCRLAAWRRSARWRMDGPASSTAPIGSCPATDSCCRPPASAGTPTASAIPSARSSPPPAPRAFATSSTSWSSTPTCRRLTRALAATGRLPRAWRTAIWSPCPRFTTRNPDRGDLAVATSLSVWNTAPAPAAVQRKGRYAPGSSAHPAKMLPKIAAHAIGAYSRPGDLVLDPMCGIGTTLAEALHLGRNALGVEYEPRWATLARLNTCAQRGRRANAESSNGVTATATIRPTSPTSPPTGSSTPSPRSWLNAESCFDLEEPWS